MPSSEAWLELRSEEQLEVLPMAGTSAQGLRTCTEAAGGHMPMSSATDTANLLFLAGDKVIYRHTLDSPNPPRPSWFLPMPSQSYCPHTDRTHFIK